MQRSDTTEPAEPEKLLTVPEVAKLTQHSTDAVRRWLQSGVRIGPRIVRLAGERIGGRWFVSRESLDTFRRDCNPDAPPPLESPTAAARRRKAEAAEARRMLGMPPL